MGLERPLLGPETPTHFFVAMHLAAAAAKRPNAWHFWVLPTLRRVGKAGSDSGGGYGGGGNAGTGVDGVATATHPAHIAEATHALGVVAALCQSTDAGRATGFAGLGELLDA